MLGASALFYLPVIREFTLWFGAVGADRKTFETILKSGVNMCMFMCMCACEESADRNTFKMLTSGC